MARLALALALVAAACGGAEPIVEEPPAATEEPAPEPFAGRGGHRSLRAGRPPDPSWELALAWLAGAQGEDGGFGGTTAADGLCLLAFLGAADTIEHGYQPEALQGGLEHLKEIQAEDGAIGDRDSPGFRLGHVLAALAMAQAHQRMPEGGFGKSAQAGLDFLVAEGNYEATPDLSPWVAALLMMAREGGLTIEEDAAARLAVVPEGSAGGEILARILTGEDPRRSERVQALRAALLADLPPADGDDPVAFTLSVLAAWQVGGDLLKTRMADVRALDESQHKQGELRGSWDPKGPAGDLLGRPGVTALHAMCSSIRLHYQRVISPR